MTLRWRLSLWYGLLSAVTLSVLAWVSFSLPLRQQYRNLDRVLVGSARLVESGIRASGRSYALTTDTSGPAQDGILMVLRSYTPAGTLKSRSPSDPGLPGTRTSQLLRVGAHPGAFSTVTFRHQRWRQYVIAVNRGDRRLGYVEALTPLELLDASARQLARTLALVTALSVLAVSLLGWHLAGSVLQPVERMMAAARRVASSRDLSERLPVSARPDELHRLAGLLNTMLGSLQAAWASQQRFVGDASHELRAPLTVLRGNTELLRRHPHLGAAERELMLGDIEKEAARMSRLVDDLLLLAQSDAGSTLQATPVSLRAVATEVVRDARRLSGTHAVRLDAPDDPCLVSGERDRLKQLLLILLDNALKYSPPGSAVTVTVRPEGPTTRVWVQDEGMGIPEEALPLIFNRFYRVDPARSRAAGGVGLGLAIAEWIATQLGGTLRVEQTSPAGTTFCLRLNSVPGDEELSGARPGTTDEAG